MSVFSSSTSGANLLAFYQTSAKTIDALSLTILQRNAMENEFGKFNSSVISTVID
jgi:hypothetical protein